MAFEFPFMCNERKCALLRNFIDKKMSYIFNFRLLKNKFEDLGTESEEESSSDEEGSNPGSPEKKQMTALYETLLKFKNPAGVEIIGMFMQKPPKKSYPDYYKVINNPMDMKTVKSRMRSGVYKNVEDFIQGKLVLARASSFLNCYFCCCCCCCS